MINYDLRIKFLVFIATGVAPISIISSGAILISVYRTRQILGSKGINTYHRLLSCLAILDIIFSIALTLGPLPIPTDASTPWGHGSQGTCSMQGFMFQVGFGSCAYSAALSIYYVFVVRYNVRDAYMTKYGEPWFHAIPLLFHFGTGILGFFWQVYIPQSVLRCMAIGCESDENTDCERGGKYSESFGLYFTVVPLFIYTGVIIICMMIVVLTVVQKVRASQRYAFEGSTSNRAQQQRIRIVVTQCLLYGFLYLNCTMWGVSATIVELSGRILDPLNKHFWLVATIATVYPLQGFFYFLIFVRPRFMELRRKSDIGRVRALLRSVWEPETITIIRGSSLSRENPASSNARSRPEEREEASAISVDDTSSKLGASPEERGEVSSISENDTTFLPARDTSLEQAPSGD